MFNAVRRANRVAQTDKEIPKSTQRAWGAATISGQPLCMLGTEHDAPKIAGKMIKEQLGIEHSKAEVTVQLSAEENDDGVGGKKERN